MLVWILEGREFDSVSLRISGGRLSEVTGDAVCIFLLAGCAWHFDFFKGESEHERADHPDSTFLCLVPCSPRRFSYTCLLNISTSKE